MRVVALTTVDNPFNPLENFEEWFKVDMQFNYNTCALLARIAPTPPGNLPSGYVESLKEQCIDRWVAMFPQTYKKVVGERPDDVVIEEDVLDDLDETEYES